MIGLFLALALFVVTIRIVTGYSRYRGRVGPPIWRWSAWKEQWKPKPDPVSEALYNALSVDKWVTPQQIFEKVPRSLVRWKWHIRPAMSRLVRRGLAERHQEGKLIRYRKVEPKPRAPRPALISTAQRRVMPLEVQGR